VFFERVCRAVRLEPSEGALAYLYGLIAHYALSSIANPYMERNGEAMSIPTGRIRTEFDRFLLEMDNKIPPYRYDRSLHINLTPGECETVAMFYPGVSPGAVGKCVKRMRMVMHLSAKSDGARRTLVTKVLAHDMMMNPHPDHKLKQTDEDLMRLYELARDHYPSLLDQIQTRLHRRVILGPDFSFPFG
jgi:hypothetical protein